MPSLDFSDAELLDDAMAARAAAWRPLWSAKTRLSAGSREGVFVMQPAKDRFGTDRIGFSATMPRRRSREDDGVDRRIGYTGTQRHVRAPGVVMGSPRFQDAP